MNALAALPATMQQKIIVNGDCWEWSGALNSKGYGCVAVAGVSHLAHRVAYEHMVGPIPEGLDIDHLCRNKLCVRPEHLEPVTNAENARRRFEALSSCKHGHPLVGGNLRLQRRKDGHTYRVCRACAADFKRALRERQAS